MALRFTQAADADIIQMYLDGAGKFGHAQAETYAAGFATACALIEENPGLAREREEFAPPVRIYRYKAHIIVFVTDARGVLILRVRHGREDWASDPAGGVVE